MQQRHVPAIDRGYWLAITFASIFGTNLGDLYAHASGLGTGTGLLVLALLFAATSWFEARDRAAHPRYYWLAIIIIRTGATNIADFLAFRLRIPPLPLTAGLAACLVIFAWHSAARQDPIRAETGEPAPGTTNASCTTNASYWAAMLGAGVFGTVLGDICSHHFGQGPAAIGLAFTLMILLATAASRTARSAATYWWAVALARTAGTCIGDWTAENHFLHLGLPLSTLLTGTAFVAILALRPRPQ